MSSNYFDNMLGQMLMGRDPGAMSHNEMFDTRDAAGQATDDRLRYELGSKRKKRKGEEEGMTSLARFPGIEHQIWAAEAGFLPRGFSWQGLAGETSGQLDDRRGRQQRWAQNQRGVLGMDMNSMGNRGY